MADSNDSRLAVVPVGFFAKARYAFMTSSDSSIFTVLASDIRELDYGTAFVFEGHETGAHYVYDVRADGQDYVQTPKGPVDLPSIVAASNTPYKKTLEKFPYMKTLIQMTGSAEDRKDLFRDFDKPY